MFALEIQEFVNITLSIDAYCERKNKTHTHSMSFSFSVRVRLRYDKMEMFENIVDVSGIKYDSSYVIFEIFITIIPNCASHYRVAFYLFVI